MKTCEDDSGSTGWFAAGRAALVLIILCGGLYPAVTALVGGLLFPHQATGSLIERDGVVVGSELVGQPFADSAFFHGRPSAAGYDPFAVSGSNWAPSNPELRDRARADSEHIAKANEIPAGEIPVDLIAASGSGIDPHISPAAALLQVPRVAAARGISRQAVRSLVTEHVEAPVLGVLGQPRVNVLELNLALEQISVEVQDEAE